MKNGELAQAKRRLRSFTGREAVELGKIDAPPMPTVGLVVGTCDGLLYTTVREDGGRQKRLRYIHKFAAKDRPMFVVSPDGTQIFLIGGRFRFTERGIVDQSDRSA